jgi:ArsR family transcriptional regulator
MADDYTQLAHCMKALADETRLKILAMLAEGELCACTILEDFDITQPTLSYHMKILCERGLVNSRKDGTWMRYSLNHKTLAKLKLWFSDLSDNLEESKENRKESCKC